MDRLEGRRRGHDSAVVGGVPSFLVPDTYLGGVKTPKTRGDHRDGGRKELPRMLIYPETTQDPAAIQGSAPGQRGNAPHRACLSLHFPRPVYSEHMQSELADRESGGGPTCARPRFVPAVWFSLRMRLRVYSAYI